MEASESKQPRTKEMRSIEKERSVGESFDVQLSGCNEINKFTISGGNDGEVPPVPIPNTEVKLSSAEGTWLDTAREIRSLPDSIFLSSSMAEHSAVNRVVVGSSPTWGARKAYHLRDRFFCTSYGVKKPSLNA